VPSEPQVPARATVRVPFEAEVVVEFERFSGFLAEYSSNLSLGGMFITTRYLKPVGTELKFELRLKDAAPLVRGRGLVAWTRWQDQGARRPAGMGVRFLDLDPDSRELIYRIVDERLRSGQVSEELALDAAALAEISAPPSVESLAGPPLPEFPADLALPSPPHAAPRPPDLTPLDRAVTSLLHGVSAEPERPPEPVASGPQTASAEPESRMSEAPPPLPEARKIEAIPDEPRPAAVPPLEEIVARAESRQSPSPAPATPIPPRPTGAALRPPAPRAFGGPERRRSRSPWMAVAGVGLLAALAAGGWLLLRRTQATGAPGPAAAEPSVAVSVEPSPPPATEIAAPPAAVPAAPAAAVVESPAIVAPSPGRRFGSLQKVTWEEADGSTELVLWLDGSIPEGSFDHSRIEGKEPRELVRLRGATGPVAAGRTEVGTPEVRRVRSGLHGSDLHVVLDLAAGARVVEARADGDKLRLRVLFR
jgi:uncharacterized protein (TIGR02266 family)